MTTTTQLTLTFDIDPNPLSIDDITIIGASKGTLFGTGNIRTLTITNITVESGESITVEISDPHGLNIEPKHRTVTVYVDAEDIPIDVSWLSASANGESGISTSTIITLVFDVDPVGLGINDVLVTGASKVALTSIGAERNLEITNITVADSENVTVTVTSPDGYVIDPHERSMAVYVAESVEGQGTLVAMPEPFYGSMYVDGTGIVIDGINMVFEDTHAPCLIKSHLNVRTSGSRRFSGLPVLETHLHIVWTLTYADGSPVPYQEEIIDPYTNDVRNPYTDEYGPVFACTLFAFGDFKLIGKAYLPTADGFALMAEETVEFSRAEQVVTKFFYEKNAGLNTNDGRHPLTIPALTNASYIESTGILTQTKAFVELVLQDEAGVYIENSRNWIYLPGHGLKHIAEKVDDSNIRLSDNYKLGQDETSLTSSNGPKQTYIRYNVDETNFIHCFSGAHGQIHEIAAKTSSFRKRERFGFVGYDGEARLQPAAGMIDEILVWQQTPSAKRTPTHVIFDNIQIDGDNRSKTIGGALTQTNNAESIHIISRNWQCVDSLRPTAFSITKGDDYTAEVHWVDQNSNYRSIRLAKIECVVVEAIEGAKFIKIKGDLSTLNTGDGTFLVGGERYTFGSITVDGEDLILTISSSRLPQTLQASFAAGEPVVVSEKRVQSIFCALSSFAFIGQKFQTDSDAPRFDHHCYPSIKKGNNLAAWCWGTPDSDAGYMYNLNNDSGVNSHRNSFIGNLAQGCEFFLDSSENHNDPTDNSFSGMYTVNNAGNPSKGFIYQYIAKDYFVALSKAWYAETKTSLFFSIFQHAIGSEYKDAHAWDYVVERNDGYKYKAYWDNDQDTVKSLALLDNRVQSNETNAEVLRLSTASATNVVVRGNNLTAPNDTDGRYIRYNGVNYLLPDFNAVVGYTNTANPQNWNDPANGDFSPIGGGSAPNAPTNLTATLGDGKIDWAWTLSNTTGDDATVGQRFYRNTVADFETAIKIGSDLDDDVVVFEDTGLTNGTQYFGWVTAFNAIGESDPSSSASATPRKPQLLLGEGSKYAALTGYNQSSTNDKVSGGHDFKFSYKFKSSAFSFTHLFGPGAGTGTLRATNTTTIRWTDSGGSLDYTVPAMSPGVEYTHEWERIGGQLTLTHNGTLIDTKVNSSILNWSYIARAAANIAAASLVVKDVQLENITTGWTINYNIDGGQVPTPPATSVTVAASVSTGTMNSHSITYHGIDDDDWV